MTILTFPAELVPASAEWWLRSNTQTFASPLTRATQTLELPGALWCATLTFDKLREGQWRVLSAWVARMRGQAGRCAIVPPHADAPRGAAGGSPRVAAVSTGTLLRSTGWTPGASALQAGDYVSYDAAGWRQLHLVVVDAVADGGGSVDLVVEPPIRQSPAIAAPLVTRSPTCVMRLADDEQGKLRTVPPVKGSAVLSLVEALS